MRDVPRDPGETLEVPFALAPDGAEVRPDAATRGPAYTCPDFKEPVILHAGIVRTHFAHKARGPRCDFWTETEAHLRAKQRIAAAIAAHKPIRFIRRCTVCSYEHEQPLPPGIARASLEHALPGGLRADVALLAEDGSVRAALEVFATHECEPEKIDALAGTPWAEFSADEILAGGSVWRPRADHFRTFVCGRCRAARNRSFIGPGRLYVECPLPATGQVLAVEACGPCRFFAGFEHDTLLRRSQRVKPVTKDGRPIYPQVFAQLEAIGRQLEARGYVERGRRPNLFVRDYRSVQFYADFGGTEEVAPWKNTSPLFYWFFRKPLDLETRQAMVLIEWRRLAGVPKRISWNVRLGHGEGDAEAEAVFIGEPERDDAIRLPDRLWTAHRYVLPPERDEQLL